MVSLTPATDAVERLIARTKTPADPYDAKVMEVATGFLHPALRLIAEDQDQERTDNRAERVIADALCTAVTSIIASCTEDEAQRVALAVEIVSTLGADVMRALKGGRNLNPELSITEEIEDGIQPAGRA